jgi:hypothetical protein
MKARVGTKPRCDEYASSSGLSARGIFPNAKPGLVVRYPKGVLICHILAVAKDQCIWGCVLSGDLTDYAIDEQLSQNWSPGTRCESIAWPPE